MDRRGRLRGRGAGRGQRHPIQALAEHRVDVAVGAGSGHESPSTGGLEPFVAIALCQPQDAETRAVALLGVATFVEDGGHELARARPDARAPRDQPRRSPLQMLLVGLGHVLGFGRVPSAGVAAGVRGQAPPVVEDLHRGGGKADLDLLVHQRVRNRVVVAVDLDVVVDVDLGVLPVPMAEALLRQGLQDAAGRAARTARDGSLRRRASACG